MGIQTATTRGDQATTTRGAFGIGNAGAADAMAMGAQDAACVKSATATSQDFVVILGGNDVGAGSVNGALGATLVDAMITVAEMGSDVFCGRFFTQIAAGAMSMQDRSICSRVTPDWESILMIMRLSVSLLATQWWPWLKITK